MGKSKRKTKALKCGDSDKRDRSLANRIFRRKSRVALKEGNEEKMPTSLREVSDTWNFPSDGLATYEPDLEEKYMRK